VSRKDPAKFVADLVVSPDDPAAVAKIQALGPLDRHNIEVTHQAPAGPWTLPIQHAIDAAIAKPPTLAVVREEAREWRESRTRPLPPMSEAEFQELVIDLAHEHGYLVAHFRPVKQTKRDGTVFWSTPVAADGAGFVDLVIVKVDGSRPPLFVELKTEVGRLSPEQERWIVATDAMVWRPSMLPQIREVLA